MDIFGDKKTALRTAAAGLLAGCLFIATAPCIHAQDAPVAQQGARTGANLQSDVQNSLRNDQVLNGQQITATVANGQVTLSGTVQTAAQRQEAETVAATTNGVSGVLNNITVDGQGEQQGQISPAAGQAPPPPPAENAPPQAAVGPSASGSQQVPPPPPPDQPSAARAPYQPQQGYSQQGYGQQPYSQNYGSYAETQPPSGPVTVPAGTLLQIRISEPLDTAHLQEGQFFQATVANDIYEGNVLAIPRGAILQGKVVHAKNAGPLGGNATLELQLTSLDLGGKSYPLATDLWPNKGPNKSGYTASNAIGGAAVGAIIGGLLGRGTGAAVGAGVGAAAGLGASAASNGPRLLLPPETLLTFHLANATTVQPVSWQEAQRLASNVPQLRRRPVYMAPPPPPPYYYGYPYRVYPGW